MPELSPQPFADDTGEPDPGLAAALSSYAAARGADGDPGSGDPGAVVAALARARVLVALAAAPGPPSVGSSAEMALLTLVGGDGRRALPVFTGTASLTAWEPAARPVPVEILRAVAAAVAEGCDLLVLDPAGPVPFQVPWPAIRAIGRGQQWLPPWRDPQVRAAVAGAVPIEEPVRSVDCRPGPGTGLRVRIELADGVGRDALDALLADVGRRLGDDPVIADRAGAIQLTPVAAGTRGGAGMTR